jgi:hypothetical protein
MFWSPVGFPATSIAAGREFSEAGRNEWVLFGVGSTLDRRPSRTTVRAQQRIVSTN